MTIKVTKKEEIIRNRTVINFYVNDILVATCRSYMEWFCTIKNGTPSNIRDRMKRAKETSWHREGLRNVLKELTGIEWCVNVGSPRRKGDFFNDDYADTTWGYGGSILSTSKIKKSIIACINHNKEKRYLL